VVMDNLGAHQVAGVREALESVGAGVRYLPPCSADLNPIEMMGSKIKQPLGSVLPRTWDALCQAVGKALDRDTIADCLGYFTHCGYATPKCRML
jgi:transposase